MFPKFGFLTEFVIYFCLEVFYYVCASFCFYLVGWLDAGYLFVLFDF
jgi:hypothetical protein